MNHNDFKAYAEDLMRDALRCLHEKNADYSDDKDALFNFNFGAKLTQTTPGIVWTVYAWKQFAAICEFMRGGELKSENIRSRFVDLICYAVLGAALAADGEVSVAQSEEHGAVSPDVGGSNPLTHPNKDSNPPSFIALQAKYGYGATEKKSK